MPVKQHGPARTSQPEAGAAYSMLSSLALGRSSANHADGQHTCAQGCSGLGNYEVSCQDHWPVYES